MSRKLIVGAAAVAACVGAIVLYRFDPAGTSLVPPCVFHAITGLQCPGCGTTRAMHALLHGDVLRALWFNPLLLMYLPILAAGAIAELRGRTLALRPAVAWSVVFTILSFWVVRNMAWYPYYR
ncbi:MAG TPA: DUF2752 domain-containing protein [Thermoanaerobaculia bacterium]|nr:DUF2752 domain-containing protein [Thermoanaerobaculia bacterium]